LFHQGAHFPSRSSWLGRIDGGDRARGKGPLSVHNSHLLVASACCPQCLSACLPTCLPVCWFDRLCMRGSVRRIIGLVCAHACSRACEYEYALCAKHSTHPCFHAIKGKQPCWVARCIKQSYEYAEHSTRSRTVAAPDRRSFIWFRTPSSFAATATPSSRRHTIPARRVPRRHPAPDRGTCLGR